MRTRIVLSALVALGTYPAVGAGGEGGTTYPVASLEAQQAQPQPLRPAASRGWLGVELVQEVWSVAGEGSAGRIRVASVVPGGPAESAGLRRGDLVVEVDGSAATSSALRGLATGLEPGAETRLVVERAGERRALVIRAAERPFLIGPDGSPVSPDSIQARVRLHMDSVRRGLDRADGPPFAAVRGSIPSDEAGLRLLLPGHPAEGRVGAPRPPGVEPLLHRQEFQVDTLVAVIRGDRQGPPRVVSIRRIPGTPTAVPPPEGASAIRLSPAAPTPGTIVALGQRAVAGAELMVLNPSLAQYFDVEEGVLAVEVVEGTPAHDAGLRPGDVILTVDGQRVRDVGEVRTALARGYASPPVLVGIIREGSERTLEFSR